MDRRGREKQLTRPGLPPRGKHPVASPHPDATDRLSKQEAAGLAKLHMKKFRDAEGRFVIEGERLVADAVAANAAIECIFIEEHREERFAALRRRMEDADIRVRTASTALLARITETREPQGIAAVARIPDLDIRNALDAVPADLPVTVLWGVSDPGNFGTIIRTADWFGSRGVLFSRGSADPFNAKTVRGTMGSLFRVRLGEIADVDALCELARDRGRTLVATVADAATEDAVFPGALATMHGSASWNPAPLLVFGSEAHGLPAALLDRIPRRIGIPGGGAESLNLAVAHGILLSHFAAVPHGDDHPRARP